MKFSKLKTTFCISMAILLLPSFLFALGTFNSIKSDKVTDEISICSFNIKFVGHYKAKQNDSIAEILKDFDIVVVQEMVAPPVDGIYPDNTSYMADKESKAFCDAMISRGFTYLLSPEDTGTNDTIHKNSSATEWFIVFYKPDVLEEDNDFPSQFLADDRSNHADYERVPYAFSFQTIDEKMDFVLISVHLDAGNNLESRKRRKHELNAIRKWIHSNDTGIEKDFIILGDMNIYNLSELNDITPDGFISLNDECVKTTTSVNNVYPYDHVMYRPSYTSEINTEFDLKVLNLVTAMEQYWNSENGIYPGKPYSSKFPYYYSDHNPVSFKMIVPDKDDDI